jgi:copper chaperone CopZ
MASSCCWLPLVLLAFGVSGAGIAGALDSYRPVFIVVTFGFLAAAFYFAYRPRKPTTAPAARCAASHGCCPTPTRSGRRRLDVMALNKLMLWGVTLLAVVFLLFPKYVGLLAGGSRTGEPTVDDPLVRTTSFTVEGMSCDGCSALVGKAIKDVPGVLSVKVDYDKKRAVVSTEACCPAPVGAILQALEKAGYRGEVVGNSQPSTGQ